MFEYCKNFVTRDAELADLEVALSALENSQSPAPPMVAPLIVASPKPEFQLCNRTRHSACRVRP